MLDDDKIQHLLFRKRVSLISGHVELKSFEKPKEALVFLSTNKVDVIFLDLHLGSNDGWEFVDELEQISFEGKVYLLSASILSQDRKRAEEHPGISGFFEKPISETDLVQILLS